MGLLPPSLMGEGNLIAAHTPGIDLPENPRHLTGFRLKPSRLNRLIDTGTRDTNDAGRFCDSVGILALPHSWKHNLSFFVPLSQFKAGWLRDSCQASRSST